MLKRIPKTPISAQELQKIGYDIGYETAEALLNSYVYVKPIDITKELKPIDPRTHQGIIVDAQVAGSEAAVANAFRPTAAAREAASKVTIDALINNGFICPSKTRSRSSSPKTGLTRRKSSKGGKKKTKCRSQRRK